MVKNVLPMKILVSIIIPTYRDWARLALCLKALQEQTFSRENFEIIVVNNDAEGEVPINFQLPSNCKLLHENKPGSYAARNAALKIASGEIIGFTDSDCIPEKDWITNAVAIIQKDPDIKRLAGQVRIFTRTDKPSVVEYYDIIYAFHQEKYVKKGVAVTANLFTYKYIFDQVGLFNDRTMSGGDFEWGLAANNAGFKIVYADDVLIHHPARNSFKELVKKAVRTGAGEAISKAGNDNSVSFFKEFLQIIRPKTWEFKLIFNKCKELNFFQKLHLISIRHYILWASDFSRIKTTVFSR